MFSALTNAVQAINMFNTTWSVLILIEFQEIKCKMNIFSNAIYSKETKWFMYSGVNE